MSDRIAKTVSFVKEKLNGAEAGHDWFHVERVWKLSKKITAAESCNLEVVELAALLHDVADPKFHNGDEDLALKIAGDFLKSLDVVPDTVSAVLFIIKNMSFKNSFDPEGQTFPDSGPQSPLKELQIVQDADRLDAIGAIGIARTFNFGGFKNNLMYDPEIKPELNMTKSVYKKSDGTTINHFYEKLLLLKDLMNTATGRKMAMERHDFMLRFLEQFFEEWSGEK